jgi:hypothetical protein
MLSTAPSETAPSPFSSILQWFTYLLYSFPSPPFYYPFVLSRWAYSASPDSPDGGTSSPEMLQCSLKLQRVTFRKTATNMATAVRTANVDAELPACLFALFCCILCWSGLIHDHVTILLWSCVWGITLVSSPQIVTHAFTRNILLLSARLSGTFQLDKVPNDFKLKRKRKRERQAKNCNKDVVPLCLVPNFFPAFQLQFPFKFPFTSASSSTSLDTNASLHSLLHLFQPTHPQFLFL